MSNAAVEADGPDVLGALALRLDVSRSEVVVVLESYLHAPPAGSADPAASLSEAEEQALRSVGALRHALPPLAERASTDALLRSLALLESALSVKQAAARLGVTEGRIRQRLLQRSLLGLRTPGGWRLPVVQFADAGPALPGLHQVLCALPADAHPVAVDAFLRDPSAQLVLAGRPTAPREWLASGGDPGAVADLAAQAYAVA